MVELNGIELGTSRFRPTTCRSDRSPFSILNENGGAERDRTVDLLNAIQALSQLSYSPTGLKFNMERENLSIHEISEKI